MCRGMRISAFREIARSTPESKSSSSNHNSSPFAWRNIVWVSDRAVVMISAPEFKLKQPSGTEFNGVKFTPVNASELRVLFESRSKEFGVGVSEMMVWEK